MLVGVPKEIKVHEYRVGLTPSSVRELRAHGHRVLVEHDAGAGIGAGDAEYLAAGAEVADTADEVSANWETWKRQEKPARASSLDGLPKALPTLVRADKVLGRAERLSVPALADIAAAPAAPLADEHALGQHLLALVADARSRGLDADRALRQAVREVEDRIRAAESKTGPAHPE